MNEEYWKQRAIQAEKAADALGSVVGQMLPYVNMQGTAPYQTYQRWLLWKDARLEANRASIQESENNSPEGQEETST